MSNLTIVTGSVENDQVIKKLFREVYYSANHEIPTHDEFAKVKHFGNNGRKIFIGVFGYNDNILESPERTLLQKILAAIKLSEDDVFIASINNILPASFTSFIQAHGFEKLLFFGVQPKQLGWHLEVMPYFRTYFMEKEMLFAEPLSVLNTDDSAKKKLWQELQQIFNLK